MTNEEKKTQHIRITYVMGNGRRCHKNDDISMYI